MEIKLVQDVDEEEFFRGKSIPFHSYSCRSSLAAIKGRWPATQRDLHATHYDTSQTPRYCECLGEPKLHKEALVS